MIVVARSGHPDERAFDRVREHDDGIRMTSWWRRDKLCIISQYIGPLFAPASCEGRGHDMHTGHAISAPPMVPPYYYLTGGLEAIMYSLWR
jgi:hypothetical protein